MVDESQTFTVCHGYRHQFGYLQDFFEGLTRGQAIGAQCNVCHKHWFPPRALCGHCCSSTLVHKLLPVGTIEAVTWPSEPRERINAGVALVRFDGAANLAMVHLIPDTGGEPGDRVILSPAEGDCVHPAAHLRARLIPSPVEDAPWV